MVEKTEADVHMRQSLPLYSQTRNITLCVSKFKNVQVRKCILLFNN